MDSNGKTFRRMIFGERVKKGIVDPTGRVRNRTSSAISIAAGWLCLTLTGAANARVFDTAVKVSGEPRNRTAISLNQSTPTTVLDQVRHSVKATTHAQKLPTSADHVHARARFDPQNHRLVVTVTVDSGYHINANPASKNFLIPTTLKVNGLPNAKIAYPPPKHFRAPYLPGGIAVYTGTIHLAASLPANRPGPTEARLQVQACSERYCLIPATIDLPLANK